jgi:hypothetical protein
MELDMRVTIIKAINMVKDVFNGLTVLFIEVNFMKTG